MRLVEEEKIKKEARKNMRQLKNRLNPVSSLPANPSHPGIVSRRGSIESVESNSSVDNVSNRLASAAIISEISLQGVVEFNDRSSRSASTNR